MCQRRIQRWKIVTAPWAVIVGPGWPTRERWLAAIRAAAIVCRVTRCVAEDSKSWAALARTARASTIVYPRSVTADRTSRELLVGEASQSSQVTPVGAGQVPAITGSQLFPYTRPQPRSQRTALDAIPYFQN